MHVVDFSMADTANAVCLSKNCAWVVVVSDAYRCLGRCRPTLDLASPSIKRNLNICQGTINDAVGLFQNITNATLIILENDSTMTVI